MADPFAAIEPPADKDQLLKVAYLACMARENGAQFQVVNGWILPTLPLPWCHRKARVLRQVLHHVERARGTLQGHVEAFPVLTQAEAWVTDLHRHHGAGAWPCWWAESVARIAKAIVGMAGEN